MADHNSDSSEDEDYVPEGAGLEESNDSGSDAVEGGESGGDGSRECGTRKTRRKRRKQMIAEQRSKEEEHDEEKERSRQLEQERKVKERVDDLWASFKQDVSSRPASVVKGGTEIGDKSLKTEKEEKAKGTVTITKTYDFAGEEVKVSKEVSKDSKEGKSFLSSLEKKTTSENTQDPQPDSSNPSTQHSTVRVKRMSGLNSVLSKISKKPKISTLEKSKLDWDLFKQKEGLEEELTQATKDGYLEKKDFLEKTQWKEFELERDERLKRTRKF